MRVALDVRVDAGSYDVQVLSESVGGARSPWAERLLVAPYHDEGRHLDDLDLEPQYGAPERGRVPPAARSRSAAGPTVGGSDV